MHLHKSVFFFPLRTGCQGDNGEQENLGLRGPFPFSHTLPQKSRLFLTSSFQITAVGRRVGVAGVQCVCTAGRICYSLIPEEWQLPIVFIPSLLHCHDSFPCSLGTGCGGNFLFLVWYFSAFTPYLLYIVRPAPGEYDQEWCDYIYIWHWWVIFLLSSISQRWKITKHLYCT